MSYFLGAENNKRMLPAIHRQAGAHARPCFDLFALQVNHVPGQAVRHFEHRLREGRVRVHIAPDLVRG